MKLKTEIVDLKGQKKFDHETRELSLKAFNEHGHFVVRNTSLEDIRNPIPLLKNLFSHNLPYNSGTSDRNPIVDNVYTATKAPFFLTLPLHSETSYSADYPEVFVFYVLKTGVFGGETTLGDNRQFFEIFRKHLDPRWFTQDIRYSRVFIDNHSINRKINRWAGNTSIRSWQEACQTEDHVVAAMKLKEEGLDFVWIEEKRMFRISENVPSFRIHPFLQKEVWFNQAHMFKRSPKKLGFLSHLLESLLLGQGEYKYFDCKFADGSSIPKKDIDFIFDTFKNHAQPYSWQVGDILVLDNLFISHGRKPYLGSRKNYACMFSYPAQ